jgi:hypothetical protein
MHHVIEFASVNGVATTRLEPPSESSSSEEQEHAAEERRLLCEQLSKMPVPKVEGYCVICNILALFVRYK